jgi:hypothetical protein
VADHLDHEALMRLIDEGQPRELPVIGLQARGYGPQEGNGDGLLTGMAEPVGLPPHAPVNLKAET